MKIIFTKQSHNWLKQYKIDRKKLIEVLYNLCNREGFPSHNTLTIHIKRRGIDSEYDIIKNLIVVGNDSYSKNRKLIIRRMVRNLLHEFRHFIQYKIYRKSTILTYSVKDMYTLSDKYWFDPDEIDARSYELKKLKYVLKKIGIKR